MREMNEETIVDLLGNMNYIQLRINDIKKKQSIDIKDIADLERYVGMQKNIIASLEMVMRVIG